MSEQTELSDLLLSLGAAFKRIEDIDNKLEKQFTDGGETELLLHRLDDELFDASKIFEELSECMEARGLMKPRKAEGGPRELVELLMGLRPATKGNHGWYGVDFIALRRKSRDAE